VHCVSPVGDGEVAVGEGLGDVLADGRGDDGLGCGAAVVGGVLGAVVGAVLVGAADVGAADALVWVGDGLADAVDVGLDDADVRGCGLVLGTGSGDVAGPDSATQWTRTELAGQFGAVTEKLVSLPDVRQA
jgi:hypothetical protein